MKDELYKTKFDLNLTVFESFSAMRVVIRIMAIMFLVSTSQTLFASEKNISIKAAGYDYDRVQAIRDGTVGIEGVDIDFVVQDIYGVNKSAFGPAKEFEVTEIGLIPYITRYVNEGYRDYVLIPVFISRTFRHRNLYVNTDSDIKKPSDLKGRIIGTPGYGMSATTWLRGLLSDEHGINAYDIQWLETTKSSYGGSQKTAPVKYYFPDGFTLLEAPEGVAEHELLLSGKVDALITSFSPSTLAENPKIKTLFPDVRAAEMEYYNKTKLFPIMHAIAIRADVVEEYPWLPKAVFEMYSSAKQKAYENLGETGVLKITLPWLTEEFDTTKDLMGDNFWKYGIEANRKELESIMRYVHDQGLVNQKVSFENLFDRTTINLKE